MYTEKTSIEIITIENDIKVTGINFEKSGLPPEQRNPGKMWDKKEVFTEEVSNGIPNVVRPIVAYGIISGPHENYDYLVGHEVANYDDANGRYAFFTIPAGKYVKVSFNAESFDKLVGDRLGAGYSMGDYWFEKNNLTRGGFAAEVYPSDTIGLQYPEMYILHPIKE